MLRSVWLPTFWTTMETVMFCAAGMISVPLSAPTASGLVENATIARSCTGVTDADDRSVVTKASNATGDHCVASGAQTDAAGGGTDDGRALTNNANARSPSWRS